jgi:hypothetical protein
MVEKLVLPEVFDNVTSWHKIVLASDEHAAFLPDHKTNKEQLAFFFFAGSCGALGRMDKKATARGF